MTKQFGHLIEKILARLRLAQGHGDKVVRREILYGSRKSKTNTKMHERKERTNRKHRESRVENGK